MPYSTCIMTWLLQHDSWIKCLEEGLLDDAQELSVKLSLSEPASSGAAKVALAWSPWFSDSSMQC